MAVETSATSSTPPVVVANAGQSLLYNPLAILAAVFDRLGQHGQAATISGFAAIAIARGSYLHIGTAITHPGDVLGDQTYESLARAGEKMTTAAIAAYAYDQIDQARTELEQPS